MYREFWRLFVKEYGRLRVFLLICGLTVVVSLLESLNIGLLVPLLQSVASPGEAGGHWVTRTFSRLFEGLGLPFKLETILLGLAVLILGSAGLKYLRMVLVGKTREDFVAWMRTATMWNLLHADISYFHQERLGTLTDTLTTQANRAGDSLYHITEIISSLGITVAYLVAAFLIAPVLTTVAFAMLLIVSLAMQYNVARARTIGTQLVRRNNELQGAALETLSGIRVIKAFLLEPFRWVDFNSKAAQVGETSYRLDQNRSQTIVLQETALFALVGGILFVGVVIMSLDIAVTVTLLFILYRLTPRVTSLNSRRQSLAATIAALGGVKAIMDQAATSKIASGERPFVELQQGVELKDVGFSYDSGVEVLQGINFTIEKGKMTAIVGASGAGKSTLIDLVLRYYDPDEGSILIDGVNLTALDLESWRNAIGVVSQDVFLFNDTVANNIALGQPGASMERIIDAAQRAGAHPFIQQLPAGYDTLVGDRGWNLSGGQRQRIALARALLRNLQILVLDEATSSLDSESEQVIRDYIRGIKGDCTIVLVAHRMSTIQDADRIVVLKDGKVAEEGNWDSLLAASGAFSTLHRLQVGG